MEFEASFDLQAKIITVGFFILFFGIITAAALWDLNYFGVGVSALLGLCAIFAYLFGTQKYVVTDSELIIKQRITEKRIPLDNIIDLQVNPSLKGMIRTFGNGGLFGYFGRYYSRELGSMKLYATQTDSRILITTKTGEKLLISPDNAYRLMEEIKSRNFFKRKGDS